MTGYKLFTKMGPSSVTTISLFDGGGHKNLHSYRSRATAAELQLPLVQSTPKAQDDLSFSLRLGKELASMFFSLQDHQSDSTI